MALGLLAVPATAEAAGASGPAARDTWQACLPFQARGVGRDLGGGRTTATLSSYGVVLGMTAAQFTPTGMVGTVLSFAGPIVFTDSFGSITAPVTGTFDIATGAFRSSSMTLVGTGAYTHVTGALTFTGHENLVSGAFTESGTEQICVALSEEDAARPER